MKIIDEQETEKKKKKKKEQGGQKLVKGWELNDFCYVFKLCFSN